MNRRRTALRVLNKVGAFRSANRVKLAGHLLNIVQLQRELNVYNYAGLTKAAATAQNKTERVKVAALVVQLMREKQAFASALSFLGRAGMAGLRGLKGLAGSAARGALDATGLTSNTVVKGIGEGLVGAARGATQFAKANPRQALAAGVGTGLAGLAAAPTMIGAGKGMVSGGLQGLSDTANVVASPFTLGAKSTGSALSDLSSRFGGAYEGFTNPNRKTEQPAPTSNTKGLQSRSVTMETDNPYLPPRYRNRYVGSQGDY